jgi:hypothetical protein
VPPPLPPRYRLEVRLGRDGDVEEWLAVDTSLERPVLIRILGPDTSPERRGRFLEAVRAASGVAHTHLAAVFTAGEIPDGAYSVSEWTGAISLADRLAAAETLDPAEFLPNAAGLAGALAALHDEGVVHGSIDPRAISYSVAHPAKLGALGRDLRRNTASDDVRDLAATLEEALTGARPGGPPPSELVDGLSPAVDRALRRAAGGFLSARALADELTAAPTPLPPVDEPPGWSRRVLFLAAALVLAATGLVAAGRLFLVDTNAPILFPISPTSTEPRLPEPTTTSVAPGEDDVAIPQPVRVLSISSFDPFGGNEENDGRLPNTVDGDVATVWRTERYRDPLPLLKPGVGVTFEIEEAATEMALVGVPAGVGFTLGWSASAPTTADAWERVSAGRSTGGTIELQLPSRAGGYWVFWITDLPVLGDGQRWAEISEVRFRR